MQFTKTWNDTLEEWSILELEWHNLSVQSKRSIQRVLLNQRLWVPVIISHITYLVWLSGFMKEQGKVISKKVFHQDNMSVMQIQKNSRFSSGEKTRHLSIRHFFIKNIKKRESIELKYCPISEMIAVFLQNHCKVSYSNKWGIPSWD